MISRKYTYHLEFVCNCMINNCEVLTIKFMCAPSLKSPSQIPRSATELSHALLYPLRMCSYTATNASFKKRASKIEMHILHAYGNMVKLKVVVVQW